MTNSFIRDVKEVLRRLRNRGISFDANRQYPAIPTIDNSIESHTNALRAIREAIETHERRNSKAALDSFVRLYELEDVLGGFKAGESSAITWATHEEVDAGAPRYKAVDPETGAYAYDRLRHVGQHAAGKGTAMVTAPIASGVVTIDCAESNVFEVVLTGDCTLADPVNPVLGQTINIHVRQNSAGGHELTCSGAWTFVNRIDPTFTATANAVDLMSCQWDEVAAKMRCTVLPDYGNGASPPITDTDLVFNNVGGGYEVLRDQTGVNINLRTFTASGDLVITQTADTIDFSVTIPGVPTLAFTDLTDVDLTGVVSGDLLSWNGTNVVPVSLGAIDTSAQSYLTIDDETAILPNSRRITAGANINFDYGTPGEVVISSTGGGGGGGGGYPPQLGHAGV